MFTCKVQNTKNNVLELTHNESEFQIVKIEGLNPPNAQINTSNIAGMDGAKFNSSFVNSRNIVIYIKLNGDVEANRIYLYSFFRIKQWCKFYYKNQRRDVYIEGYVENVACDLFSNNEIMQISLLCPQPYFKDVDTIIDDISKTIAAFEFPFAIDSNGIEFSTYDQSRISTVINNSEIENGIIIKINVVTPCNKIQIRNTITAETFTMNYNFIKNDIITINTNKGEKSVNLKRGANVTNLFTALSNNSKFFQLEIGNNFFSYLVDDGTNDEAIEVIFEHNTIYGGV